MDPDEQLRKLESQAEAHYEARYETRFPAAEYASAKDAFGDAIAFARSIGDQQTTDRLVARLEHVKAVFRTQFA